MQELTFQSYKEEYTVLNCKPKLLGYCRGSMVNTELVTSQAYYDLPSLHDAPCVVI